MNQLSLGKVRALQSASTERGVFTILAVDHRDAMRAMLNREQPETVSAKQLTDVKLSIVKTIGALATAVLFDPVYIQNDRYVGIPGYESWWDVATAEVSEIESVKTARAEYEQAVQRERYFLR